MKEDKKLINIYKTRKYLKYEKNKKYYPHSGIETYLGEQRTDGKTISGVRRVKGILKQYPKVQFITNVIINGIKTEKPIKYFKNCEELVERLREIDINNNEGYLIFMDERTCCT